MFKQTSFTNIINIYTFFHTLYTNILFHCIIFKIIQNAFAFSFVYSYVKCCLFLHSHHMRMYRYYVKNQFRNFYQIFTFSNPLRQQKRFLRKCLSVCPASVDTITFDEIIEKKNEFINQPHLTEIVFWNKFL